MNDSYLISQTRCPECARSGRDRSGNNLANYSDGHSYCYSCGYYISGSKVGSWVIKNQEVVGHTPEQHKVYLPADCDTNYPQRALAWIEQYELTKNDLYAHNVLWSESNQRLIFPYYGSEGLLAWQGRYFGQEKKGKWFSQGNLKELFHVLGSGDEIILVEDIVSAIKVSRYTSCMPIFGSYIGSVRFKRLKVLTKKVVVWLDPDKRKESITELRRASLMGLEARIIYSDKDPKEESYERIQECLK